MTIKKGNIRIDTEKITHYTPFDVNDGIDITPHVIISFNSGQTRIKFDNNHDREVFLYRLDNLMSYVDWDEDEEDDNFEEDFER